MQFALELDMILNLLSGPRNISTAMMYSFMQRADTTAIDEPYYGYHLKHHNIHYPGRDETLAALPTEAADVEQQLNRRV